MFLKVIGTLLLLGFFYVQLGTSLDCYSCNSPTGCRAPSGITCSTTNANVTTAHLNVYYSENLTSFASLNFECFHHNYTSVAENVTYKGCIYRQINPCALTFRPQYQILKRQDCYKCAGNLCNRSPAGTFSSSMMTMLGSIIIVAIYKGLNM